MPHVYHLRGSSWPG